MGKNSPTSWSTIVVVMRLLAGVFIAGAGIAWIREPDTSGLLGAVQVAVGIALICEAAYQNLVSPRGPVDAEPPAEPQN